MNDSRQASAAEGILTALMAEGRAVAVGSNSYGSSGQPYMGPLPGGGRYGICTMKCFTYGGADYHNVGVRPDIPASNTIEHLKCGYDHVFDVGLKTLKEML